ncbi:ligand-binding sensor domain-containing protein [Lunatimonas lonarensis]|uniref:ligand-binding sensor domain-containing protein n=1 Tax=Lunatimonas lonarensis TaxID=1232681 RepID=UPI0009DC3A37|nr:sensor histidine kinase [Lunatimonas lonarensis]
MKSTSALFLCFWLVLASAASPLRFFDRITVEDGLASNNVYAVWQDKKGYLWIGTSNGLQRFDGNYFLTFGIEKPHKLPAQPVRQIMEDKKGRMWIRYGDAYGIYNPATLSFQAVPFEKNEVRFRGEKLWMDEKGNIYVLLRRNKLLVYDPLRNLFTEDNLPVKLPPGYQPNTMFEDAKTGYYWIGCEQGMAVYDPKNKKIYHNEHNPLQLPYLNDPSIRRVSHYHIDSKRIHRMVYWNPEQYFVSYDEQTRTAHTGSESLNQIPSRVYRETSSLLETATGECWYFGVNTLYQYKDEDNAFDSYQTAALSFSEVYHMYEDKEGGIWIATDEGIYHNANYSPEITYREFNEGEPQHLFLSISEIHLKNASKKEYWIGSWGRGLVFLDEDLNEIQGPNLYHNLPDSTAYKQPWCLLQERNTGLVWIGAQLGILQVVDPESKQLQNLTLPIFRNATIRSISQDGWGNIWFTTQRGDLIRYRAGQPLENSSFELIREFHGFSFAHTVDKENRVWVCTSNNGVFVVDGETGETLRHLDDRILSSNKQEKMLQLNDSIFFFGYDLLNAYNANSEENRVLSYSEGLISNDILHMQADREGFLWIYTPNGICRYNYFQNSFTHYGKKDGFGPLERDGYGGTLTTEGKIIFTGYHSLVSFNPSQFNSSIKPDRPSLTNIKLFDHFLFVDSLNSETKRTFAHDQNAFTFYFSTLTFTNQDKLKYFHRLSGIDEDWQYSGQSSMAVYSLLPPGDYTLEYRSENEEGMASTIGSFFFRITPPFHESWWFRLLLTITVLFMLSIMYRLHINRILAVVKVRNRVARDLHDDMGSTLSTINILSTMAKTKIQTDPAKASEYVSKITDNCQRMMEAMDDIVWSIKPQNDSMDRIIARMREFANQALEAKNIDFQMEVAEEVFKVKLPMDARRDLFLIFKESVNNLAKYAKCTKAHIRFSFKKGKLQVYIKDNGQGFDLEKADAGNGLSNMKKRAQNMGGELKIISQKGVGTEVLLTVGI